MLRNLLGKWGKQGGLHACPGSMQHAMARFSLLPWPPDLSSPLLTPIHHTGLLKQQDNGVQLDASALMLLQRVASSFPLAAKQLLQMGVEDTLRELRPSRDPSLQQLMDSTLSTIMSAPVLAAPAYSQSVTATPAHAPSASVFGSISAGGARAGGASLASSQWRQASALRTSASFSTAWARSLAGAAAVPPVNRPLELEFSTAGQATPAWPPAPSAQDNYLRNSMSEAPASALRASMAMPPSAAGSAAAYAWTPAQAGAGIGLAQSTPSMVSHLTGATGVMDTAQPASRWTQGQRSTAAGATWAEREAQSQAQPLSQPSFAEHLSADALAVVGRMRAERAKQEGAQGLDSGGSSKGGSLLDLVAAVPAEPTDWLLPGVTLSPGDEQHLFELVMRLKYVEDPARIVAPAVQVGP